VRELLWGSRQALQAAFRCHRDHLEFDIIFCIKVYLYAHCTVYYSPLNIGARFCLKASKASNLSLVDRSVSYEALSKSRPVRGVSAMEIQSWKWRGTCFQSQIFRPRDSLLRCSKGKGGYNISCQPNLNYINRNVPFFAMDSANVSARSKALVSGLEI
jgi:hypothetical protein